METKELTEEELEQEMWKTIADCFNRLADTVEDATGIFDKLNKDLDDGVYLNLPALEEYKPEE